MRQLDHIYAVISVHSNQQLRREIGERDMNNEFATCQRGDKLFINVFLRAYSNSRVIFMCNSFYSSKLYNYLPAIA